MQFVEPIRGKDEIIKVKKVLAKINLTLEIVNKREDGFHNIKSIMQMINLYLNVERQKMKIGLNHILPIP